jgi:dTMP kinase
MIVVLEGVDGSGKDTQARLLQERLLVNGHRSQLLAFPRYGETFFSREIARYLNGEFGELMSIHPKLAAVLFAGDRHESRDLISRLNIEMDFLILDRYTPSNQAHHAAKLPSEDWPDFFAWVETLEYETLAVPRPDLVLFLDLDAAHAVKLIGRKPARVYTARKADIHEVDAGYQQRVYEAYKRLSLNPNWVSIRCLDNGKLRTANEIHEEVWGALENRRNRDFVTKPFGDTSREHRTQK